MVPPHLSGHLWNAALLVVSASVALAADRLTTASTRPVTSAGTGSDISGYVGQVGFDSARPLFQMPLWVDPFGSQRSFADNPAVASPTAAPTVPTSATGRSLTAILIADERRVAVIDDAAVRVGDVLRDGARVSSIQPDRVWVVERDGRWRMLTLTNRGQ